MVQLFDSIIDVKQNYKTYDAWDKKQDDRRAQKEYLAKTLDIPQEKRDEVRAKTKAVVRATRIMDGRSEDNCENTEMIVGALAAIPAMILYFLTMHFGPKIFHKKQIDEINKQLGDKNLSKEMEQNLDKKLKEFRTKSANKTTYLALVVTAISTIGGIFWSNSKEKEASRIGRYQARTIELQNAANFVMYTPEQIKEGKKIAKTIKNPPEDKGISKIWNEFTDMMNDKKAYKEWQKSKDPNELEKLKNRKVTPQQMEKAIQDKELIVDVIKDINNTAEDYSENMENAFKTLSMTSFLLIAPLTLLTNLLLTGVKASAKIKWIASAAVGFLVPPLLFIQGTSQQKDAARVGRYVAQRELLKNPDKLLAFSDEEMKKASHIKSDTKPQTFWQKMKQNFKFLKTYKKDLKEYEEYKKTIKQEEDKLYRALKKVPITEKQKLEAKQLQQNVFRAFDQVDEKSQRYSEDVEATCEATQNIISMIFNFAIGGAFLVPFMLKKVQNANWVVNKFFDGNSIIRQNLNKITQILKNDKTRLKEFNKSFKNGDLKTYLSQEKNADIKKLADPITEERNKIFEEIGKGEELKTVLGKRMKDSIFGKYFRNLLIDIAQLKRDSLIQIARKNNIPEADIENISKSLDKEFNYKNYATLINTGLVAGIPVIGIFIAIPYLINSYFTNIQKKAGKIGVMQATKALDDPRIFVPDEHFKEF